MDTFFHQYPIADNTQGEIANVTSEKRIYSDILAETINGFIELKIKSTINDSEYYNSWVDDAESDPKSDPKVDTYTK